VTGDLLYCDTETPGMHVEIDPDYIRTNIWETIMVEIPFWLDATAGKGGYENVQPIWCLGRPAQASALISKTL
jgi:hypothetical protein